MGCCRGGEDSEVVRVNIEERERRGRKWICDGEKS